MPLTKAQIEEIKSSSESDEYLAWQYGVSKEDIQEVRKKAAEKKQPKKETKNK